MQNKNLLTLKDASYGWLKNNVISNVNLSIYSTQRIAISGPNGSGKTTLLKIIAGLLKLNSGTRHLAKNCRIAFLPTDPLEFILPWRSLGENIEFFAKLNGFTKEILYSFFSAIQFPIDCIINRFPSEVSFGQKVAFALAIVTAFNSDVILLDESFSHLGGQFLDGSISFYIQNNSALIFTTHQTDTIAKLSTIAYVIKEGVLSNCVSKQ